MSDHDTPREPLARMMYVDPDARAERPRYAIRSINTAGLKSELTQPR